MGQDVWGAGRVGGGGQYERPGGARVAGWEPSGGCGAVGLFGGACSPPALANVLPLVLPPLPPCAQEDVSITLVDGMDNLLSSYDK